jgi:hypothetical protein
MGRDAEPVDLDALRAAAFVENGLGAREGWTSEQGVGYAAFRAALAAEPRADADADAPAPAAPSDDDADEDPNFMSPATLVRRAMRGDASPPRPPEIGGERDDAPESMPERAAPLSSEGGASGARDPRDRFVPATVRPVPGASPVSVLRWSKQGPKTIAVGREDGTVDLVSCLEGADTSADTGADTGADSMRFETSATLRGHSGAVLDVDFSLGGDAVVTASTDGDVRLWSRIGPDRAWACARRVPCGGSGRVPSTSASTGAVLAAFPSAARAARFHPSNENLVFVGRDARSVWLINASTGHVAASVSSKTYMRSGITALCVDETGGAVWAGDEDGKVFAISSTRSLATTTAPAKPSRESSAAVESHSAARESLPIDDDSSDGRSSEDRTVVRHPTVGDLASLDAEIEPDVDAAVGTPDASVGTPPPRPALGDRLRAAARAAASRLPLPRLARASRHRLAIVARVKPPFGSGSRGGVRTLRRFAHLRATRGPAIVAFFRDGTVAVYRAPTGAALGDLSPVSAAVTPGWPAGGFGGSDASPPRNPIAPLLVVAAARGEGAVAFALPETHGAPAMRDAALTHGSGFGAGGIASAAAVAFDGDGGFVAVGYGAENEPRGGVLAVWRRVPGRGDA